MQTSSPSKRRFCACRRGDERRTNPIAQGRSIHGEFVRWGYILCQGAIGWLFQVTVTYVGFLKWGYPQFSSIYRWDFPSKKPTSYFFGTPVTDDLGRICYQCNEILPTSTNHSGRFKVSNVINSISSILHQPLFRCWLRAAKTQTHGHPLHFLKIQHLTSSLSGFWNVSLSRKKTA